MLPKSRLNSLLILRLGSFSGSGRVGLLVVLTLCCNLTALDAPGFSPLKIVSAPNAHDVRPLASGQRIERDLAGGESHAYRITAQSGEYVSLLVEPRGVELKLKLSAPDGQQVAQVEGVVEGVSGRTLSLIADRAGDYQLIVSSSSQESTRGGYQLRVAEWRPNEPRDVKRVAAERAVEEAEQLDKLRQAEASRKAITKYEEALTMWRDAGDHRGEAVTHEKISSIWRRLSEFQKSLDSLNLALQLRRDMGDRNSEASTRNEIGQTFIEMAEYQKALDHYDQALHLQTGNRYLEFELLNNIGAVYRRLGDYRKAQDYYRRSVAVVSTTGDRRSEAIVTNNLGVAAQNLGEYQQALDSFEKALSLSRSLGDGDTEGMVLGNLGTIYSALGENQQAVESFKQTIQLRRAAGSRFGEANGLSNLGNAYRRVGERDQALECLNQALAIYRSINDRAGEAVTLRYIGAVHEVAGDHQQALDYFSQSLQLSRAIGNRTGEAASLQNIARTWNSLGDYAKSRDDFGEALRLFRESGDRSNEASTLLGLARTERSLSNLSGALTQIESAIGIIELLRSRVASTDLRATYQAANQDYYQLHIDLLMQLERERPGEGHAAKALQVSERARSRSLLDLLTETQADLRRGADSSLIERERMLIARINANDTRRRQLLSRKRDEAKIAAVGKELSELLTRYREVQAEIRARSPRYAALTQPQPLNLKEIQERLLDKETLLLEYKLGRERSYLWAVTPDTFRSFDLPAGGEIDKAARRVSEFLLASHNQGSASETPRERSQRLGRAKIDYHLAAARLSQTLLGPVAKLLGKKRLVIVSDGALHYVPFGALPIPSGDAASARRGDVMSAESSARRVAVSTRPRFSFVPLIVEHEVVTLPSASVLSVLRQEQEQGRARTESSVAVLADPVFGANDVRLGTKDLSAKSKSELTDTALAKYDALERSSRDAGIHGFRRLRFSRDEALAITGLVPSNRALSALDFKASRATAVSPDMGRFRVVHFATHGLLNTQHPELSGLVLSLVDERGQPQDGFLRLHEVYSLKLNADLVVLSGCETALGKEIRGEGLIGLTRGFMYAGAPRVIASLWNVNDRATARLMKHFYQRMLGQGMRPAAALREAQVAMWKEQPDAVPHLWAAFVLQGEWR